MSDSNKGPIYGVELINVLPLGNGAMLQQMPNRKDLEAARLRSERTVAGYEVLLAHYKHLKAVCDYLDNPEVLLDIRQPHRMELSKLLHGEQSKEPTE